MTSKLIAIGLGLLVLGLAAGCGKPVEQVREWVPGPAETTLGQAFDDLLDQPQWTLVKSRESDPAKGTMTQVKYVVVSGNLAGTQSPFEARYRLDGKTVVFTQFSFKEVRHEVGEFDLFLSSYYLTRALQGTSTGD